MRNPRVWKVKEIPIRFILPNVLTLLALCSGVTAIRLGIEGRFEIAVAALLVAVFLDAIDGRVARLLQGSSRFGAELDSLADFVNFGVAPGVLIYLWTLSSLGNLGWIVALGLSICCALRLARFNVAIDDPEQPLWTRNFFVGVPAPAGGGLALLPIYMGFLGWMPQGTSATFFALFWTSLVSILMVSRLPVWSGKVAGKKVPSARALPLIACVVLGFVVLIAYPWGFLTFASFGYLALIPWSMRQYAQKEKIWQTEKGGDTHDL